MYYAKSSGENGTQNHSEALAPVIALESGIKIDKNPGGDGSEGSPWVLTK